MTVIMCERVKKIIRIHQEHFKEIDYSHLPLVLPENYCTDDKNETLDGRSSREQNFGSVSQCSYSSS